VPHCHFPAVVHVAVPTQSITLRYKYMPGQVRRYKLHTSMDTTLTPARPGSPPTSNVTQDMVFRQTVQKVRASDGAATSLGQIEEYHVFLNGKETALPYPASAQMKKPYIVVSLPSGKVISLDISGILREITGAFPSHALQIGESWKGAATTAPGAESGTVINTLTGFDTTGGVRRAIIQQKMTGEVTGAGTLVFDLTTGTISRLASVTTIDMRLGTTTLKQRFQVTLSAVEEAKKTSIP